MTEENRSDFVSDYGQDLHENKFLFPFMHRQSTFITLYNYLEHNLNEYCTFIEKGSESKIKLIDLKHTGLERALLYLKRIPSLDLNKINTELSFIKNANKLRNRIIHAGGILPAEESEKVNTFVKSHENLVGEPGKEVVFREGFVPEYINILESFFESVGAETTKYLRKRHLTVDQR